MKTQVGWILDNLKSVENARVSVGTGYTTGKRGSQG